MAMASISSIKVRQESLSAIHLSAKRKWEPQRTNNFEVSIFGLPGGKAAEDALTLSVNAYGLPNISNDPIEVGHGNSKVKFAGQTNFSGSESLEFNDYIGVDIENVVSNWHREVYNPITGQIGWAEDYKKDGTIVQFGPDGSAERTWRLEGMWPSAVSYGDTLNYDGAEVKKCTMTISYDRALIER